MIRAICQVSCLLLLGCGTPAPTEVPSGPELRDVRLSVGVEEPVVLTLAGAWLEPGGARGEVAQAEVPGAPPLVVRGERSTWSFEAQAMVFLGGVQAERGEVQLSCERLEVRYAGERITEARASGDVVVRQGERVARGGSALLTAADGRILIEGEPSIVEGPHRMRGERIAVYLDDERLECEACELVVAAEAIAPTESP